MGILLVGVVGYCTVLNMVVVVTGFVRVVFKCCRSAIVIYVFENLLNFASHKRDGEFCLIISCL